ncbi:DNA polymerase I [Planctomycetota bacterium]|nr:DNA polymerase I [Planctomycetota bacterium]
MPNFFIIDGHSQIFRAYYSPAARRRTVRSKPVGAIYLFTRMLQRLIRVHQPDYLVCALDPKGPTFRNDIYDQYKANRGEMPEDLREQMPVIIDMIKAWNIPVALKDGWEADDVIATLSAKAADEGFDVRIVSKDKDLKQLLTDKIMLLDGSDDSLFGVADLDAQFGLTPAEFIELQALAGDSVDNIPGAKGIGPKTAAALLKEYGSLDEILNRAEDIKQPKRRENLIAFREHVELSRQLVTIRKDVPVELDIEGSKLTAPDQKTLQPLLTELNFKSILKDLGWAIEEDADSEKKSATGKKKAAAKEPKKKTVKKKAADDSAAGQKSMFGEAPPKPKKAVLEAGVDYTVITDEKTLEAALKVLSKAKSIGIHAASESYAAPAGVALASKPGQAWYLPFNDDNLPDAADSIRELLASNAVKIGHNLKHDKRCLMAAGLDLKGDSVDTRIQAFLLDGSREDAKLAALSREFLGKDTVEWDALFGDKKTRKPLTEQPAEKISQYACQFADYALRVADTLSPMLKKLELAGLANDVEYPLVEVLSRMEFEGIRIDVPYLNTLAEDMGQAIETLQIECHELAGKEFNIGSPKQLAAILFDDLGLPAQGKTAKGTGRSTDVGTLEKLKDLHDLPAKVLEFRHLSKLKSTYVDQLPDLADSEGRVHTTYRQTVATGRLSSKDPNLQNIPVRTESGRKIRKGFVAKPGYKLIVADYSQIELRILAHIANEEGMIEAFKSGDDIHAATASKLFGIATGDVNKDQRNIAKTVNFGVLYGQSAFGLSQTLGIPRKEAKEFINNYFEIHPKVAGLTDAVLAECKERGFVTTLAGRKRYLPEITSKNVMVRKGAERQAFNTVLQGTAADLIKMAMLNADIEIRAKNHPWRMLLQVHDELVFESPEESADECAKFAERIMSGAMELKVPLDVDAGIGSNWLEAK